MEHRRAEEVGWSEVSSGNYTGKVRFGLLCDRGAVNVVAVRFEAGARTDWHSHPKGQVLYVVEGRGRIQDDSGTTVELDTRDTLYAPPGQVHWHGASPDGPMTHLSLTTGGDTVWEPRKVTDEQYNRTTPIQVPREKDVMFHTLQALGAMGGSGDVREVVEMVGRLLGVTEEQWIPKNKKGVSKLDHNIQFASSHLQYIGCLTKPSRGVWQLTASGEEYIRRSQTETIMYLNDELTRLVIDYRKRKKEQDTSLGFGVDIAEELD